jgi:uncharacterized glyoxalase superfamily protein PhnB
MMASEARSQSTPSVSPYLVCAHAAGRIMHACLRLNGSTVMLSDEFPDHGMVGPAALGGSPVTIHLMVHDVDAAFARAVAAGATVTMELADQFWGDRYGSLRDPFGHHWSLATHLRDMTPEQIREAMAQAMPA